MGLYLLALLVSLTGLTLLDYRFKLVFFRDWLAGTVAIAVGVAFFLVWDLAGIIGGIFFRGHSHGLTGLMIAPELPLEEVFFLILLCYTTLEVFLALGRFVHGRRDRKNQVTK